MKKINIVFIILSCSNSHAFVDSILSESSDVAKGAAISTIVLDELAILTDDGEVDSDDLKSLALRNNSNLRTINNKLGSIYNETQSLKSIQDIDNIFKRTSATIKSSRALFGALCSLGANGCAVASNLINYQAQKETNIILQETLKEIKKENLNKEIEKQETALSRMQLINDIQEIPEKILSGMKKSMSDE